MSRDAQQEAVGEMSQIAQLFQNYKQASSVLGYLHSTL